MLIGKGGETIRYLQFNSGAKIQILRDSEADPNSALRPVEIIGTVACIENAERLISAVIAEVNSCFFFIRFGFCKIFGYKNFFWYYIRLKQEVHLP